MLNPQSALQYPADNNPPRIPHDELEALQASLRAYAGALLGRPGEVEDLVQETNLYLLSNDSHYQPGTNFRAWAFSAVYYRVLAWKRDRYRNREDLFSEETLEIIARASTEQTDAAPRAEALKSCLGRLSSADRELLEWKYVERRKLSDLAKRGGSTADSLHQKVSRLRQGLRQCIHKVLSEGGTF